MDINVKIGDYILNCRAVGIIINDNKVLFQKKINDKYWALPGGKIMVGETGADAIKRELNEELGVNKICIKGINSVSENFFNIGVDKYHQYMFSYIVDIDKDSYVYKYNEFLGNDCDNLIYKWFDLDKLEEGLIKPDYLKKLLKDTVKGEIKFISNQDE